MIEVYRNGIFDADTNTYYLGRAKIILSPRHHFPKSVPRIVDKAIREETDYNVLMEMVDETKSRIKLVKGNHYMKSSVEYMRIGDKYIPLATAPSFFFDVDKVGEYYRDIARWIVKQYYLGYYKGYNIRLFIQSFPQYYVQWEMKNIETGSTIIGREKYDPYKLEELIEKQESGYMDYDKHYSMFPSSTDDPNIIQPKEPPAYEVYSEAEHKAVLVGSNDGYCGVKFFTNGKILLKTKHVDFSYAAELVGDAEAFVDSVKNVIEIRSDKIIRGSNYIAVKVEEEVKFGYLDEKIHGDVPINIDLQTFQGLFGKAYDNITHATVKDNIVELTYESQRKSFTTKLKIDYGSKTVTGYIPDFTGWRFVKNVKFDEVVEKSELRGMRKRFPSGYIPVKIVQKVVAHTPKQVTFITKNGYTITINSSGRYTVHKGRILISQGSIRDLEYVTCIVGIEENNPLVFYI